MNTLSTHDASTPATFTTRALTSLAAAAALLTVCATAGAQELALFEEAEDEIFVSVDNNHRDAGDVIAVSIDNENEE